ncbi:MAG: hypothetical protein IJP54_04080 [Synergistaceae bacterium]|nr:hypothetical protein [Synergistaceae bacterium]
MKRVSYDTKIALRSYVSMNWSISADESLAGDITGMPAETGRFFVRVTAALQDAGAKFEQTYSLMVKALPAITTAKLPAQQD